MFVDENGKVKNGIAKVRYSHDAMIDVILANPNVRQNTLAELFDRTPGWISLVVNSDAFKARLAERKAETTDQVIIASMEERLQAAGARSLEILQERLEQVALFPTKANDDFLLKTAQLATAALGYGARNAPSQQTNVAVVVQVPAKIKDANEWASAHFPAAQVVEG